MYALLHLKKMKHYVGMESKESNQTMLQAGVHIIGGSLSELKPHINKLALHCLYGTYVMEKLHV